MFPLKNLARKGLSQKSDLSQKQHSTPNRQVINLMTKFNDKTRRPKLASVNKNDTSSHWLHNTLFAIHKQH